MNRSLVLAAFMAVAGGATAAYAIVSPYYGSETSNVTKQAFAALGILNAYFSGDGQRAMSAGSQQTAPMGRMLDSNSNTCAYTALGVPTQTSASAIVTGLNAIDILASKTSGASAACNGAADNSGTGLAYSDSRGVFQNGNAGQTWKWILALLYGGLDLSNPGAGAVCDSTARRNLVANWSQFFQTGCSNGAGSACSAAPVSGALWHAFRPGDASDTAAVFAAVLGLSPLPSVSTLNGFGTSPYCNALNWDTSVGNGGSCALGAHKQWVGPGGVLDPVANDGVHRRPPPGTWGDTPDPTQGALGADVMPTQMQDNDPIRRSCLGSGATDVHARVGEEVCNINGTLGLVLPIIDSDWMWERPPGLQQYPTNACTGYRFGKPANVFTCAPRGNKHAAECPDGDYLDGGSCLVPIDGNNNTSQCVASKSTQPPLLGGGPNPVGDGRIFNTQMYDGTATEPVIGYARYDIASVPFRSVDFAGVYHRIHQVETALGATTVACQMVDVDDQIACLTQADPCSIGFAGNGAMTWASRPNGASGYGGSAGSIDAMRVGQTYPSLAAVQKLGTPGEYPLAQKLYFASLPGFGNIAPTSTDPSPSDELTLGRFEATPSSMNPLLTANGLFTLGTQSPAGTDTQFCEDFNESTICGPVCDDSFPPVCSYSQNINACATNPAGIPTISTVCGNGVKEAYEECDDGTNNGGPGDHCSLTCRCVLDFNQATGVCN